MKTNRGIFIISALLIAVSSVTAATNDMTAELQKGLFEEEANHNLEAAIKAYENVIRQFDKDRKLAATAIFRLGESFRKQGKTNEAAAQYQRVLREFSDQSALTTPSSQALAGLGKPASETTSASLTTSARQEQKRLYEEEIKLAEKQLAAQQKQVENGKLAPDELIPAQRDLLNLKRKLAALDSGATITETAIANEPSSALTPTEAEEVKRIQAMIKNSPDLINAKDGNSTTPLHRAATAGQLVVAEFLLKNGAEVSAKDWNGRTPLHYAASAGQKAMVELLLANKANIQAPDNHGYTALHLAAENGMRSVAELLVARGSDINARNENNVTPLHLAIAGSFDSVAQLLIGRNADLNVVAFNFSGKRDPGVNYSGTPLMIAVSSGNETITSFLLSKKAKVDLFSRGLTPLHNAASGGRVRIAKQLIEAGANVNEKSLSESSVDLTPLFYALNAKKTEIVELLLDNKADPNARFNVGPNANQKGVTPLIQAASMGTTDIVTLLLKAKADPNLKSDSGRTPLFEAIATSETAQRKPVTQLLLENGADANSRDYQAATPLMRAAYNGDKEIVELLLAHKADVNAKDERNNSALHYACWNVQGGRDKIAEMLIVAGADVNARDNDGRTPLQLVEGSGGTRGLPGIPAVPPPPINQARYAGYTPIPSERPSEKMATLLRGHGALEEVPKPDAIQIRRPGSNYPAGYISNSTNDWNQFTFLEVFGMENGILTKSPQGEAQDGLYASSWPSNYKKLAFPNLERVRIRRPATDLKSWQDKVVDVSPILIAGDCSKDFRLEWGDVVEIVEADHPLNQNWPGFSTTEWLNLKKCLSREIEVIVKGRSSKVTLAPEIRNTAEEALAITTRTPFWIKPALRKTNLLLASSDLAHIRVKRVDPKTGVKREWLLDCSDSSPAPEFWLRDGDVIEVPDKT